MIELQIGLDKIDRIYHISDIHLRNFKRHQEYREVFQRVKEYINRTKTPNSVICLTGDIVHSKNDITPELVQEVTYLLTMLSEELIVIVIPGNHDANLNNNNRLDSLTPIISAMKNPKVHYLKDSGVFKAADTHFIHWSVFDKPEAFIKPQTIESANKIGLYHGAVKPFDFVKGFEYSSTSLSSTDFEGFDMVLLGDLHTQHYVDRHNTVGYPGSTIQQNHGEGLNHGILVWDVKTRSAEYVEMPNDTAYYTIDVDNGVYEPIPDSVAKRLYLRVRYKNTDYSVIKQIIADIKAERDVVEVTQQKINTFEKGNYQQNRREMPDVRSVDEQNQMLAEYLFKKFHLNSEDIASICAINTELNAGIKVKEASRNVNWAPRRFEFSNMFSYGENNVIDFMKMTGTYGVFAPNASGKSSLLSALEYCIFDKCSKTSKAAQVMNNTASTFNCKLEFELNGLIHIIERRAKKSKTDTVKVDVDFYYINEQSEQVSLNGKERSETNQIIREMLGSYEDFILTSMSIQGNNTGFIDMGQSDRKNLLVQFLDIAIFDALYDLANDKVKELSVLVKEYKKVDYLAQLETEKHKQSENELRLKEIQEKKDFYEAIIQSLNHRLLALKGDIIADTSKEVDVDALEANKTYLQSKIAQHKIDIGNNTIQHSELSTKLETIDAEISEIDSKAIEESLAELAVNVDKERKLTAEVERIKADMVNKLDKMAKLEDLEYDESCSYCMNNVFVKDAISTKESIAAAQEVAKVKVQELRDLRETVASYDTVKKSKENLQALTMESYKVKALKSQAEAAINDRKSKIEDCLLNIQKTEDSIKRYYESIEAIKKNEVVRAKAVDISKSLATVKERLSFVNNQISDCNSNIQMAKKSITSITDLIEKLQKLEEEFRLYGHYLSAVSKDGIPYTIISTVIPLIEEDINNILSQVVEFKISIKSDGKNINAFIVYDDSRTWPIELASGMEKFVSSIAIRTALINISSLPRPNFLALDEGFGVMDVDNMGNVAVLMDYLKTQFRFIMMISHIDAIKDVVDSQIEVVKGKSGTSKVQFI